MDEEYVWKEINDLKELTLDILDLYTECKYVLIKLMV